MARIFLVLVFILSATSWANSGHALGKFRAQFTGNTCVPADETLKADNYEDFGGSIRFRRSRFGLLRLRCAMPAPIGAVNRIEVTFKDTDGTNANRVHATFKLINGTTGQFSDLFTFDSNSVSRRNNVVTEASRPAHPVTPNFKDHYYYVEIDLRRDVGSDRNPTVYGVRLLDCRETRCLP